MFSDGQVRCWGRLHTSIVIMELMLAHLFGHYLKQNCYEPIGMGYISIVTLVDSWYQLRVVVFQEVKFVGEINASIHDNKNSLPSHLVNLIIFRHPKKIRTICLMFWKISTSFWNVKYRIRCSWGFCDVNCCWLGLICTCNHLVL